MVTQRVRNSKRLIAALLATSLATSLGVESPAAAEPSTTIVATYYVEDAGGGCGDATPNFDTADYTWDDDAVQAALNTAAGDGTNGAVIHLCAGSFGFSESVIIGDSDTAGVRIEGDSSTTTTVVRAVSADFALFQVSDCIACFGTDGAPTTFADIALKDAWASSIDASRSDYGVTIESALFEGNTNTGSFPFFQKGGAVYAKEQITINDSTFIDNKVDEDGGAIYGLGSVIVTGSVFEGNVADDDDDILGTGVGGAIYAGGNVTITDSTFDSNSGQKGGGVWTPDDLTVSGSTFVGNGADADGGALFVENDMTAANSTFVSNTAGDDGGAIWTCAGGIFCLDTARLTHVTFKGNSASDDDNIFWDNDLYVKNTIFADGDCQGDVDLLLGIDIDPREVQADSGNLKTSSSGECWGAEKTSTELKLQPLDDNGGPTETIAIVVGSVAINYANIDTSACAATTTDQRGVERPAGQCDVGAFELGPVESTISGKVSIGDTDIVSGDPAILSDDTVTHVATVSGEANDGDGGFVDPTGTVAFYYCWDPLVAVTTCDDTEWTAILGATAVALVGGDSSTDGYATATLSDWSPVEGPGWYLLSVAYGGAADVYEESESTDDTADASIHVLWPSTISGQAYLDGEVDPPDDLISAEPSVRTDDLITYVVTVTGDATADEIDYVDPTTGTVDLYYCYDEDTAPTSCTDSTWTAITGGADLSLDGGDDATDGEATATLTNWSLPDGDGWYLISAVFDGEDDTYAGSELTNDTTNSLIRARVPVTPYFNGPFFINSSGLVRSMSLSALVVAVNPDEVPSGCLVEFEVEGEIWTSSGATGEIWTASVTGTTLTDGRATAALVDVPLGLYTVTVAIGDSRCIGVSTDTGSLSVLPGTVQKGHVAGAWYRLSETGGWAKTNVGSVVSLTSSYNKRTGVTTTTTKGQLLWISNSPNTLGAFGWRLRSGFNRSTTDGSSIWQSFPCPSTVGSTSPNSSPRCGRYTWTGVLQERNLAGEWVTTTEYGTDGVVTFTLTVYDGGTVTTCARKVCKTTELADWFGLTIDGVDAPDSVTDELPQVGAPVKLKSGSIRVS
ncbi:MAG: choice-of-anchor Q domain-containing protein [Ilumatobacteraceae bacterium]